MPPADLQCLWASPDQAGFLKKRSHQFLAGYQERFFVLKGSTAFYFKDRHNVRRLQGAIPLEGAKVETELPPATTPGKKETGHFITITLHVAHSYSAKHPFYVLQAPSAEVQAAWANALWQAAIPRGALISQLQRANLLGDVAAAFAQQLQLSFPTADASVLSSAGRAQLSGLGNVGQLAGALRRDRPPPAGQDLAQPLPRVSAAGREDSGAATILARTDSGTVVPAVMLPATAAPAAAPASAPAAATTGGKSPGLSRLAITATAGDAAQQQWHANPLAEEQPGAKQQRAGMQQDPPPALIKAAPAK